MSNMELVGFFFACILLGFFVGTVIKNVISK